MEKRYEIEGITILGTTKSKYHNNLITLPLTRKEYNEFINILKSNGSEMKIKNDTSDIRMFLVRITEDELFDLKMEYKLDNPQENILSFLKGIDPDLTYIVEMCKWEC